ncbi:uncharacterized protein LOC122086292 [Macadamia integrifolia]|uniref:uncharacterized protein LOC122086292 n=1 Tax=Macadamia integrifolia TaxID=60698 RepID=UPI001C4FED59|nr:uncharacterized protein LOC122086292 [Macadamia integrifolia]
MEKTPLNIVDDVAAAAATAMIFGALYNQAGKEVVDFLFNLLALPAGTVVKLLTKDNMVGSLGNLYKRVENLSESYLEPNQTKLTLLEPKLPTGVSQVPFLLSNRTSPSDKGGAHFYRCSNGCNYLSSICGSRCPSNGYQHQLSVQMTYVAEAGTAEELRCRDNEAGYVKGLVTYMVMDDLSVTPFSTISGITLLNNFNVREVGSLEERVFDLEKAGKEVVDFLFNLLALPVGTVVKLLTKDNMVGSLGNLYKRVENLSESYLEPNQTKLTLLEPKLPTGVSQVPFLLSNRTSPSDKGGAHFYRCSNGCNYVSSICVSRCPSNGYQHQLSVQMTHVAEAGTAEELRRRDNGAGYVKGLVTYMVMDDLSVTPFSTISGITLLNNFNVREVGSLEERVFDLDINLYS